MLMPPRNGQFRISVLLVLSNGLALGVAFGLHLSGEQTGAIVAFGNSLLLLVDYVFLKELE